MVLTKAINCSHSSNSLSQDNQATYQDGIATDIPLAVVVNGNTASAAEVMTAALKENKRATIVGEQTFGKGIIQTIRQLGYDNGGVAVTVARYETPLHNNINKSGISVDINVECTSEDAAICVPSSALKK
jgi:carboxyl-terminal processing protease